MLKFVILLAIAAAACADDVDLILGEVTPMAIVTEKRAKDYPQCLSYNITKTGNTCNCEGLLNLPVVVLEHEGHHDAIQVIPIIVKTEAEAAALATNRPTNCSCQYGPQEYGVIRIINDNYFMAFLSSKGNGAKPDMGVLHRKKIGTRAELQAALNVMNLFSTEQYVSMCDQFTD